jgi:hypothetical protein
MNLTFVPNALEKISPTWVMSDITYLDGIITRTEDDYLRRIGSTFKGISFLGPGYPAWFEYSKDNLGASKSGFLHTSLVKELEIILDIGYAKLAITTEHSIFFLESAEPVQETAEIRELMDQINALNK